MTENKNNNNKDSEAGYGKDALNSVVFMVIIIILMIVIAHFRP